MTEKQIEALRLREAGWSYQEIADALGLRWRESASQLVTRARVARRKLLNQAAELFPGLQERRHADPI